MKLLQTFRIKIKKNYPNFYNFVRSYTFGTYSKYLNKKRQKFIEKSVVNVQHDGINFKIEIDPTNGFVDSEIFSVGVYEPDILSVIKKHLQPSDTFVDIGTNIGQHSLFAAGVVGTSGRVISFEPIPKLIKQLKTSIALNNLSQIIEIKEYACSDKSETLTLKIRPDNIGGSGFHHDSGDYEEISVETICADEILLNEHRIDFIKIDTEGHELEVLLGLKATLEKFRPILLIEFSPSFWGNEKMIKSQQFFTILMDNHYTCYDLELGHQQISDPLTWYKSFTKTQTNILCIAK